MFWQFPICVQLEYESGRDVSSSLVQKQELRSSVVALLDSSDRRTQQHKAPEVGWVGKAVSHKLPFLGQDLSLELQQATAAVR